MNAAGLVFEREAGPYVLGLAWGLGLAGYMFSRADVPHVLAAFHVPLAQELQVKPGEALLSVRRDSYNEAGVIVDILECLYNPKRYQFAMVLGVD